MERVTQDSIVAKIVDGGSISARSASEKLGRTSSFVQNIKAKEAPALGSVSLIADVYGYDVALINRETGEVDYIVEPPK